MFLSHQRILIKPILDYFDKTSTIFWIYVNQFFYCSFKGISITLILHFNNGFYLLMQINSVYGGFTIIHFIFCQPALPLSLFFLFHSTICSVLGRLPWCLPESAVNTDSSNRKTPWRINSQLPSTWLWFPYKSMRKTTQRERKKMQSKNNMQFISLTWF